MGMRVIGVFLPVTAPSAHSGFSKGSLGLYVIKIIIIGMFVCEPQSHLYTTSRGDGAMGKSCANDPRVTGSSPAGKLSIFSPKSKFPQCFFQFFGPFSTRRNFQREMIFSFVFWCPFSANWSLNKRKCRSARKIPLSGKWPLQKLYVNIPV